MQKTSVGEVFVFCVPKENNKAQVQRKRKRKEFEISEKKLTSVVCCRKGPKRMNSALKIE